MDIYQLAEQATQLRSQFISTIAPKARDQYERSAFRKIEELLIMMERECKIGELKSKSQRFSYIARLVVESDPEILPPKFGEELIKLENSYRKI